MNRRMSAAEYDLASWMHVYAQSHEHAPAEIRGTREALVALRDAIDRALKHPNGEAECAAFACDGEGYGIEIRRVPRSTLQGSRLPYLWYAHQRSEGGSG